MTCKGRAIGVVEQIVSSVDSHRNRCGYFGEGYLSSLLFSKLFTLGYLTFLKGKKNSPNSKRACDFLSIEQIQIQ